MKVCTKCEVTKSLDQFYDNIMTKDGKQSWCKACQDERSKERYKKLRALKPAGPRGRKKADAEPGFAVCFSCRIEKPLEQFYEHMAAMNGRTSYCKACTKAKQKERYAEAKRKYMERINGTPKHEAAQESQIIDLRGAVAEGISHPRQSPRAGSIEFDPARTLSGREGSDQGKGE